MGIREPVPLNPMGIRNPRSLPNQIGIQKHGPLHLIRIMKPGPLNPTGIIKES